MRATLELLSQVSTVHRLCLRNFRMTDDDLTPLEKMKNLVELDMPRCPVVDAGYGHLAGLAALERLNLDEARINDRGLARLRPLHNLRYLNLRQTWVTDAGMASLAGMQQLEELYLCPTRVTDRGLGDLKPLVNLRMIELPRGVTGAGLANLKGLPRLNEVFPRPTSPAGTALQDEWVAAGDRLPVQSEGWLEKSGGLQQTFADQGFGEGATFSENGRCAAASAGWHGLVFWEVGAAKPLTRGLAPFRYQWIRSIAFAPDNRAIALAGDRDAFLFSVPDFTQRLALDEMQPITALAFAPTAAFLPQQPSVKFCSWTQSRPASRRASAQRTSFDHLSPSLRTAGRSPQRPR